MKIWIATFVASAFAAGSAWAQPAPFNEAGVTFGHWHLNSKDAEANKKIFVAMGGTAVTSGGRESVRFPGVIVNLTLRPNAPPPTAGTAGSVINHVGFLVPNVQEAMAKWKVAGVPIEPGRNRTDQAFVTTPDGLRVEILEDKNQKIPIQNHHVHFFVPETQIPAIQAWYVKVFDAKASMRGNNKSDDLPGVNLTFGKTAEQLAPTKGRVLDHIGFDLKDLKAFLATLDAKGVKIDRPYEKNEQSGVALAFIHDEWGTTIELNERPAK